MPVEKFLRNWCLRIMVDQTCVARVRNEEVRRRIRMEREMAIIVDQSLPWFGQVERLEVISLYTNV